MSFGHSFRLFASLIKKYSSTSTSSTKQSITRINTNIRPIGPVCHFSTHSRALSLSKQSSIAPYHISARYRKWEYFSSSYWRFADAQKRADRLETAKSIAESMKPPDPEVEVQRMYDWWCKDPHDVYGVPCKLVDKETWRKTWYVDINGSRSYVKESDQQGVIDSFYRAYQELQAKGGNSHAASSNSNAAKMPEILRGHSTLHNTDKPKATPSSQPPAKKIVHLSNPKNIRPSAAPGSRPATAGPSPTPRPSPRS